MSDCKFQVGQTYKTRDGREAKVVAVVPGTKDGFEIAAVSEGRIFCYRRDGKRQGIGESGSDLLPNNRTVWVNFYQSEMTHGEIYSYTFLSEQGADEFRHVRRRLGNRAYPVEIDE